MPEWLAWLLAPGVLAVILTVGYKLHQDAVAAERRRADDHREAAAEWRAVAAERQRQVDILLGRGQQ